MTPELVIRDRSEPYPGGVQALNATLSIPTGIVGSSRPNGAGKSTLMRTIATLQEPRALPVQNESLMRSLDLRPQVRRRR